jgi:hypothetical protein
MKNYKGERLRVDEEEGLPTPVFELVQVSSPL